MLWDMYTYVFVCMLIFIITGLNMNAKTTPLLQVQFTAEIMTKKGRKKLKIAESNSDTEVVKVSLAVKTEIVYEDTKAITVVELELKWGQIYPMLVERKVPEASLGDLALYENILRYGLTKIATRSDVFPCV